MADPLALPGATYARDKTGVRRIELPFLFKGPTEADGPEPWEQIDSFFVSNPPMGLPEAQGERKATKNDDGDWVLTLIFEGVPDGKATEDVVELDDSSVDSPIETHLNFEALAKKWGAIFDGEKFDGWKRKIKDPGSSQLVKNPFYGISHYLDGNVILRITKNLKEFDSQLLKNLRKIDKPDLPTKASRLNDTPAGMTWLKRGVKVTYKGNTWQYVIEWVLGMWAPDLYAARS